MELSNEICVSVVKGKEAGLTKHNENHQGWEMFVTLGACGGSRVRDPGLPGRLDGQSTWIMNEVPRASHSALLICCKLQSCKVSQPPRCAGARSCGGW